MGKVWAKSGHKSTRRHHRLFQILFSTSAWVSEGRTTEEVFVRGSMRCGDYSARHWCLDDTVLHGARKRSLLYTFAWCIPPINVKILEARWGLHCSGSTASSGRGAVVAAAGDTAGHVPPGRLCSHLNKYLWAASVPVFLLHLGDTERSKSRKKAIREIEQPAKSLALIWEISHRLPEITEVKWSRRATVEGWNSADGDTI